MECKICFPSTFFVPISNLIHSSLSPSFYITVIVIARRQNTDNDIDDDNDDDKMEGTEQVKKQKQITRNAKKKNCNNIPLSDYPHRLEALANLGVKFQMDYPNNNNNDNDCSNNNNNNTNSKSKNWDSMFQKLVDYKEEHGTLRFPSDEQCAATKNEDFIALQRWVKGQVLTFRSNKKNKKERKDSESVRRLREIGFDFEKWFAKPGKMTKSNKREEDEKG